MRKVSGVKDVSVSLMTRKGIVELAENASVSDEELKKAVSRAGYKAVSVEEA